MTHISLPLGRPFIKAIRAEILKLKKSSYAGPFTSEEYIAKMRSYNQALEDVVNLIDPPMPVIEQPCPKGDTRNMGPR